MIPIIIFAVALICVTILFLFGFFDKNKVSIFKKNKAPIYCKHEYAVCKEARTFLDYCRTNSATGKKILGSEFKRVKDYRVHECVKCGAKIGSSKFENEDKVENLTADYAMEKIHEILGLSPPKKINVKAKPSVLSIKDEEDKLVISLSDALKGDVKL